MDRAGGSVASFDGGDRAWRSAKHSGAGEGCAGRVASDACVKSAGQRGGDAGRSGTFQSTAGRDLVCAAFHGKEFFKFHGKHRFDSLSWPMNLTGGING